MDINLMTEGLKELSDIKEQERLWLSDGKSGREVSSFDEATAWIFLDSRFDFELSKDSNVISKNLVDKLLNLRLLLRKASPQDVSTLKFIRSQEMQIIRKAAQECLSAVRIVGQTE